MEILKVKDENERFKFYPELLHFMFTFLFFIITIIIISHLFI